MSVVKDLNIIIFVTLIAVLTQSYFITYPIPWRVRECSLGSFCDKQKNQVLRVHYFSY